MLARDLDEFARGTSRLEVKTLVSSMPRRRSENECAILQSIFKGIVLLNVVDDVFGALIRILRGSPEAGLTRRMFCTPKFLHARTVFPMLMSS